MASKKVRIGVLGAKRGMCFAGLAADTGAEVVALCDTNEQILANAASQVGAKAYTDYDAFLEHDMDAVVLANYFHQHAPFAIKALEAGLHVMSETSACKTLGEGVALARAVEKSGKIYLFAENYPYFVYNQEMRRLYQNGVVGELQYGEGEYIHPVSLGDKLDSALASITGDTTCLPLTTALMQWPLIHHGPAACQCKRTVYP